MNKFVKIIVVPLLVYPAFLMANDSEADMFTHEIYSPEEIKSEIVDTRIENINKEIDKNPTAAGVVPQKNDNLKIIYGVNIDDAY